MQPHLTDATSGAADSVQQMRIATREGARAHLPAMGTIWAIHIASTMPSKSGLRSSGDAHTSDGRASKKEALITRCG